MDLNILIPTNASTDEVTDTIADVFKIGLTVENALEDGFQLTDVLAAIQLEPIVREVINDLPTFFEQFRQLKGATAIAALKAARDRTESEFKDIGRIGTFIYNFLNETATTFLFIEGTVISGIKQLESWKALFETLQKEPKG